VGSARLAFFAAPLNQSLNGQSLNGQSLNGQRLMPRWLDRGSGNVNLLLKQIEAP
jgi:hypothetical protein